MRAPHDTPIPWTHVSHLLGLYSQPRRALPTGTPLSNWCTRPGFDRDRKCIVEKRTRPTGIISLHNKGHLDPIDDELLDWCRDREQDDDVYQEADLCATVFGSSSSEDGEERHDAVCALDAKEDVAEEGALEPCLFPDDRAV